MFRKCERCGVKVGRNAINRVATDSLSKEFGIAYEYELCDRCRDDLEQLLVGFFKKPWGKIESPAPDNNGKENDVIIKDVTFKIADNYYVIYRVDYSHYDTKGSFFPSYFYSISISNQNAILKKFVGARIVSVKAEFKSKGKNNPMPYDVGIYTNKGYFSFETDDMQSIQKLNKTVERSSPNNDEKIDILWNFYNEYRHDIDKLIVRYMREHGIGTLEEFQKV